MNKKIYSETNIKDLIFTKPINIKYISCNKNKKRDNNIWVHVGVGKFHRSHQCYILQNINNKDKYNKWDIIGIELLPFAKTQYEILKSQNFNYILQQKNNEKNVYDFIHIIKNIIYIPNFYNIEHNPIFELAIQPNLRCLSITITEKGYYILPLQQLDINNHNIQYDINNWNSMIGLRTPKTIYGLLASICLIRKNKKLKGFIIFSCDNILKNGNLCKFGFIEFLKYVNKDLIHYVNLNIAFPNSMVDCITPNVNKIDCNFFEFEHKIKDKALIISEPFKQWVIENVKFNYKMPNWKLSNQVIITNNIHYYEKVKLLLLNSLHTFIALLSFYLYGKKYITIDQAIHDKKILKLSKDYLNEVKKSIQQNIDLKLDNYIDNVICRFQNKKIKDKIERILEDTSIKIQMTLTDSMIFFYEHNIISKQIIFMLSLFLYYINHYDVDKMSNKDKQLLKYKNNKYDLFKSIIPIQMLHWNQFMFSIIKLKI